jgi:hypothetical protein
LGVRTKIYIQNKENISHLHIDKLVEKQQNHIKATQEYSVFSQEMYNPALLDRVLEKNIFIAAIISIKNIL